MLFKKVMAGAFYYVYKSRLDLSKALLLPFIAYLAMGFTEEIETEGLAYYLLVLVGFLIQTIFAITTHRIILLGKGSTPEWGLRSWSKRETYFLLHAVALTGLMYLLIIGPVQLDFVPMVFIPIALIFILWLWARFSLVFPGIAIDQGVSFKTSWYLTKDYQLLMLLVVVAFPMLLAVPEILLNNVPYSAVISNVLSTFVIVFEVAALSMAYQLIASEQYANG